MDFDQQKEARARELNEAYKMIEGWEKVLGWEDIAQVRYVFSLTQKIKASTVLTWNQEFQDRYRKLVTDLTHRITQSERHEVSIFPPRQMYLLEKWDGIRSLPLGIFSDPKKAMEKSPGDWYELEGAPGWERRASKRNDALTFRITPMNVDELHIK